MLQWKFDTSKHPIMAQSGMRGTNSAYNEYLMNAMPDKKKPKPDMPVIPNPDMKLVNASCSTPHNLNLMQWLFESTYDPKLNNNLV